MGLLIRSCEQLCFWHRADFIQQVAPGLGPPRPAQREKCLALPFTQTVSSVMALVLAQQGGVAVSRLDGCGFSLTRTNS